MSDEIKFVIPKGSLEAQTFKFLKLADLEVIRKGPRDYNPKIKDFRISAVKVLRPQEIPKYVAAGYFDLGITGLDWVRETGRKVKIVLAVHEQSTANKPLDLKKGSRISTEYPNLAQQYFTRLGVSVDIFLSYGATEAKVPDIMDGIVELTETGETLRRGGLKVIDVILESSTVLIANEESYLTKRRSIDDIKTLILGAINAQNRVSVSYTHLTL